jgi:mannose-6-phosphate isomerase-like protein (cupin superfamily)
MSFYNFKLDDPSSFSTSSTPDTKNAARFVHKTFEDFQSKPNNSNNSNSITFPPKATVSNTVMTPDGRGKFIVPGWKEKGVIAPGGETSRFRLSKPVTTPTDNRRLWSDQQQQEQHEEEEEEDDDDEGINIPEEIRAVSIMASMQGITHTYSPVNIGTLNSLGSPTSIRLVKLSGQSTWHSHDHTDEVFILLRGAINMLYRSRSGSEKIARVIGGELLCVPMRMEHCVVADEGTEVLLLEGNAVPLLHGNMLILGNFYWYLIIGIWYLVGILHWYSVEGFHFFIR